jgi:hypothetical protein
MPLYPAIEMGSHELCAMLAFNHNPLLNLYLPSSQDYRLKPLSLAKKLIRQFKQPQKIKEA